jgi:hypothetical protein
VTRLSNSSVVQKVLVQLWFLDGAVIVAVNVLVDRFAKLGCVWLKKMGKMTGLGLWGNPTTGRSISRET